MSTGKSIGRLIIAGGRDLYVPAHAAVEWFNNLMSLHGKPSCVLSGGCRGADKLGEAWARAAGLKVELYPAKWSLYGRSAGPIRNREMAGTADAVALLPGGAGTEDMRRIALEMGLAVYCYPSVRKLEAMP